MPLSSREIKDILAILEESGWEEAEVEIDDVKIVVAKGDGRLAAAVPAAAPPPSPGPVEAASAPHAPPPPPAAEPAAEPTGHLIRSPSVGVFWRSPEPGAAPFVEVGDQVTVGQTLCIVEVMKLMQHVTADVDGEITAIHAENAAHVEFDTPLFSIAPA